VFELSSQNHGRLSNVFPTATICLLFGCFRALCFLRASFSCFVISLSIVISLCFLRQGSKSSAQVVWFS
jgi:hypothetical protein